MRSRVGRRSTRRCAAGSRAGRPSWPGSDRRSAGCAADESLRKLRTGDVIRVPAGRRAGLAIVLSDGAAVADTGRLVVLTADRQVKRLSAVDFPTPVEALGKVRVGRSFNPRSPQSRRDLASSLRELGLGSEAAGRPEPAPRRQRAGGTADDEIARLRRSCAIIPCTPAPTASSTCAGPSGPTGCGARLPG